MQDKLKASRKSSTRLCEPIRTWQLDLELPQSICQLAHNLVVWAAWWIAKDTPELAGFGVQRWVRDLLSMAGRVVFKGGRIVKVQLSQRHSLTRRFYQVIKHYFAKLAIEVDLGYQ